MSGVMKVLGALLLAGAILFAVLLKVSSAQMQVWGISPEVIATLLVGGILSIGLGGLIDAVMSTRSGGAIATVIADVPDVMEIEKPAPASFGFNRKKVEAAAPEPTVSSVLPAAAAAIVSTPSVADTIAALEQAKSDIKTALGGVESLSDPAPEAAPAASVESDIPPEPEVADDAASDELYVLEEKIIRGRPSRILSDDTVEAETDEGWMRFENLEHLNEYLDSVEEADA